MWNQKHKNVKVISFDVDGTLIDKSFVDTFWEIEIPKLYAKKYNLDFNEAWKMVKKCYDEVGDHDVRWYLPKYWFDRFNFVEDPEEILWKLKDKVKVYPDAKKVLKELYGKYTLIVTSNASWEFLNIGLEKIKNYFSKIYSCTSDFGEVRKTPSVYLRICNDLKVKPNEIVHVGDHYEFDYLVPRSVGIEAYLIDRKGKFNPRKDVLKTLEDLLKYL